MKYNHIGYNFFILLLFQGSYLMSSQQPSVAIDIWKSIATLRCYKREQYRLCSALDLQIKDVPTRLGEPLILELKPDDNKSQSFCCSRLNSDTLLLLSLQTQDNRKIVFASCFGKGDSDKQLIKVGGFYKGLSDKIRDAKMLVLYCEKDAGLVLTDELFLNDYKKRLREAVGVEPEMIGYNMIAGKDFRDKDHFECQIDRTCILWRSAIDKFQDHRL